MVHENKIILRINYLLRKIRADEKRKIILDSVAGISWKGWEGACGGVGRNTLSVLLPAWSPIE